MTRISPGPGAGARRRPYGRDCPALRRSGLHGAIVIVMALLLAACGGNQSSVRGSGTIEMDEVDVSSLVGGRVVEMRANEGDHVRAGDTLVVLDRGEITAELRVQRAQSQRATAELRDVSAGPRAAEIQAARADWSAAKAQTELTQSDLARTQKLFDSNVASAADLDRARGARDMAVARQKEAQQKLRLLEAGSRRQQIEAARQAAEAAHAEMAASLSRVGELVLTAPVSGVVLLKNFEAGEIAAAGIPVITLGNPDSLWMRVFVAAPKLVSVRLGAPVEVRVHGASRAFAGRVVEIASKAEFTPRAALTEEEQANLVFGVKVALAKSDGALKAGLPADALITATPPGGAK